MGEQTDARVMLAVMAHESLGSLYLWGAESDHLSDCSGFVCNRLTLVAAVWPDLYDGGRLSSSALDAYYEERGCHRVERVEELRPGMLVWYARNGRTYHVAIHLATLPDALVENRRLPIGPVAIESSGGSGSATNTPRGALRESAGVRLTATDYHGAGTTWWARDPFRLLS